MAKQKTAKQKSRRPAATERKTTAKRAPTARKAARKKVAKAAPKARKTATRTPPKKVALARPPKADKPTARGARKTPAKPTAEVVETTSAGTQPLAPEHAAVDEMTSSGNELLDIFQRYDRKRVGYIDRVGFTRLLEALGQDINDEELEIALDIVDVDRSGRISWKEFKNWWLSR